MIENLVLSQQRLLFCNRIHCDPVRQTDRQERHWKQGFKEMEEINIITLEVLSCFFWLN